MVLDHLEEVWRAALAASGDQAVAQDVTTAVLRGARADAAPGELVRGAVLAAVRRAPAPAFAAVPGEAREAVALARIAGCEVGEVAATLGVADATARTLLTEGLGSVLRLRAATGPRTPPPALGCGSAAS